MANSNEVDYPPEATIGDQWARAPNQSALRPPLCPADLRRRIAKLAYEFYLQRGKLQGYDLEDWLKAQSLVLSELTTGAKPTGDRDDGKEAN